jgi:squalene-hopene/tetraprenyl-beta-curcumene cyclase
MKVALTRLKEDRLQEALCAAASGLRSRQMPEGCWEGRLSSSALSTATAMSALALARSAGDLPLLSAGVRWLLGTQGEDGGWGDTPSSPSNISTTLLALAALRLAGSEALAGDAATAATSRAEEYLAPRAGRTAAERRAALEAAYGRDRTFAVPILVSSALAGTLPWEGIPRLPFELALFPHGWYRLLRLHVVSYALPALIAVGIAIHRHEPPRSLLARLLRRWATPAVLRRLERIQPDGGGFLEATPLTSFVAMSLLSVFGPEQLVARKCLEFIRKSVRSDGSWPIDTNLSVWLTTASASALTEAGELSSADASRIRRWLLAAQHRKVHPYTGADPGGWAWTDLPGGVPDADDTAGAILALLALGERGGVGERGGFGKAGGPVADGIRWLLRLQNSDGGWPTFCRGWGKLPFDRSAPDLTAHALRAIRAFDPEGRDPACARAARAGLEHLRQRWNDSGPWRPLWFGNPWAADQENPVVGTARVLRALAVFEPEGDLARSCVEVLLGAQEAGGSWSGAPGLPSTVEETALAVSALAGWPRHEAARKASLRGARYLAERIEDGSWTAAAPLGLYFARLWYSEELYPMIWTVEALARVMACGRLCDTAGAGGMHP